MVSRPSRILVGVVFTISALLLLALVLRERSTWTGDARLLMGTVVDSCAIVVLVALVAAAGWSSHVARRGLSRLEDAAPRVNHVRLARVLAIWLATLGGIGVTTAVVCLVNQRHDPWGTPPVFWLVPTALAALAMTSLGYSAGRLLRWPALSLALAPLGWVVLGWAVAHDRVSALVLLQGFASLSEDPYSTRFLVHQSLWLAAAAAAGLALNLQRTAAAKRVALVALAGCMGWYTSLVLPGARTVPDPEAGAAACSAVSGSFSFCATAAERPIAPQLAGWSAGTVAALAPLMDGRQEVVTSRLAATGRGSGGERLQDFAVISPVRQGKAAMRPDRSETIASLVENIVNPNSCMPFDEDGSVTLHGQVLRWAYERVGVAQFATVPDLGRDGEAAPVYRQLTQMDDRTRDAWLRANSSAVLQCS